MPTTKEQALDAAKALGPQERQDLIEKLRQVSDGEDLTAEQRAELRRRIEAIDRSVVETIPGDQVMRDLHDRLTRR